MLERVASSEWAEPADLPQGFRATNCVRDWLPIRREQCVFTEEQMVAIIREADREPVSLVAKRHEISEETIYTWRKRFGGFQASEVRRLKQLEAENARLKKLVAERDLEIEVMKEVAALVSAPARRVQAGAIGVDDLVERLKEVPGLPPKPQPGSQNLGYHVEIRAVA
jgi:putative transposase